MLCPVDPAEFYYHFCSEASVTVQLGNAAVLEAAIQAARCGSKSAALRMSRSVVQVPGGLRVHIDVR